MECLESFEKGEHILIKDIKRLDQIIKDINLAVSFNKAN